MRRVSLLAMGIGAASAVLASQAAANTPVFVTATFAEPIHPTASTCPGFPDASCGRGEVIPLGQATDTVQFGVGCGGTCDLRTIYLAGGSITLEETSSNPTCPGGMCHTGPVEHGSGTLADVVIGGTGLYEGATGTLTGTVTRAASNVRPAGTSTVKLSGTI